MSKLILLIGLLFTTSLSHSQKNKFEIGLEGGPSLIRLFGNSYLNSSQKLDLGFAVGLGFQYNINPFFSLRTQLGFERKGSKMNIDLIDNFGNLISQGTTHYQINYLNIPILGRANFGQKIKFFVQLGPYFGVKLGEAFVTKNSQGFQGAFHDNSTLKKIDLGFTTGLGLSIPIKEKFAVSIEARNNLGLFNISNNSGNNQIKTNTSNLLAGFSYRFN